MLYRKTKLIRWLETKFQKQTAQLMEESSQFKNILEDILELLIMDLNLILKSNMTNKYVLIKNILLYYYEKEKIYIPEVHGYTTTESFVDYGSVCCCGVEFMSEREIFHSGTPAQEYFPRGSNMNYNYLLLRFL